MRQGEKGGKREGEGESEKEGERGRRGEREIDLHPFLP